MWSFFLALLELFLHNLCESRSIICLSFHFCSLSLSLFRYTTSPHLFSGHAKDAFARVRDKVCVYLLKIDFQKEGLYGVLKKFVAGICVWCDLCRRESVIIWTIWMFLVMFLFSCLFSFYFILLPQKCRIPYSQKNDASYQIALLLIYNWM